MPLESKVMLGGREYILATKVSGVTEAWRKALFQTNILQMFEVMDDALEQIVTAVTALREVSAGASEGGSQEQWAAGLSLATLAPAVVRGLGYCIDDVKKLLFDYSKEIDADREWIAENVYDEELIGAFIEVVKLNFPIGAFWGWVAGSRAHTINTNLPSANGAHATKKGKASGGTKVTSDQLRRR